MRRASSNHASLLLKALLACLLGTGVILIARASMQSAYYLPLIPIREMTDTPTATQTPTGTITITATPTRTPTVTGTLPTATQTRTATPTRTNMRRKPMNWMSMC